MSKPKLHAVPPSKKAMFYIIDAFLFATIILAALFMFPPQAQQREPLQYPSTYISTDLLNVINEMSIEELSSINDPVLNDLIAQNNISDINGSVLITLGSLWADDEVTVAGYLANATFAQWLPASQGFGVFVEDEALIATSNPYTARYASSWKVVSGIEKTKPYKGFVAQAKATQVSLNNTKVFTLSPQGAGWEDGRVYITTYVNLTNTTLLNAQLVLSVHADRNNNDVQVDINSGACSLVRDDFVWQFGTDGNVGNTSVTGCLIEGDNVIEVEMNNDGYNAHLHPGTQLIVDYESDLILDAAVVEVSQRYYFDDIVSVEQGNDGSGVWSILPFFIPQGAQNTTVDIQVVGNGIRDYNDGVHGCDIVLTNSKGRCSFQTWTGGYSSANSYDFLLFLNTNTPLHSNATPATNVTYRYNTSQLSSNVVEGTNIAGVYFNNYGDYVWGQDTVHLYADPVNDPDGSSFVEVNYTLPVSIPFGMIEVSNVEAFGGSSDNDKTVSFAFPTEAEIKSFAHVNIIQRQSWMVTQWADTFNPPTTQVFTSPSARAVPSTLYTDDTHFALSSLVSNYIRVRDTGSSNDILPTSNIEYNFYVPSFVGFGDVFATQAEAEADAIARLDDVAGSYIAIQGVETSINTISDVPTLWGPSVTEVRVWE